jgi:hypothetical protein
MDLTVKEGYLIKLCMKLIAVISHDNYYGISSNLLILLLKHFKAKRPLNPDHFNPSKYLNTMALIRLSSVKRIL